MTRILRNIITLLLLMSALLCPTVYISAADDTSAPSVCYIFNYNIRINNISDIKEIRFARGRFTQGSQLRAASDCVTLSAKLVNKNTENNIFSYEMPKAALYTFWIRKNSGQQYFIYADLCNIETYTESYGMHLTVKDYHSDHKDIWIARGIHSSYREMKNNAPWSVQISEAKLSSASLTHDYTYTCPAPDEYTVLIRHKDGTDEFLYTTLTADIPVFNADGLRITVSNIPDIKIIRTASGQHDTASLVKAAPDCRNFSNKSVIKNARSYMIQYRNEGWVTLAVEYNNGYVHIHKHYITPKYPELTFGADYVVVRAIEDLNIVRYAKGSYHSSAEIKRAPDSRYLKAKDIKDGALVIDGLSEGMWSISVQYNDESVSCYSFEIKDSVPTKVTDISECRDTTQKYLLPDGYVYAYRSAQLPDYDNALETAQCQDSDKVFYGKGYINGNYLSIGTTTAGEHIAQDKAYTATGYITYDDTDGVFPDIYIKGLSWNNESHSRMFFFKEDKSVEWGKNTMLNINGKNGMLSSLFDITDMGENYIRLTPKESFNKGTANGGAKLSESIAYLRLSLKGKGEDLIISIGKPINTKESYTWINTGMKYYEDKGEVCDPLYGKRIVFTGDSICHALTDESGKGGWAGRIGSAHYMEWHNTAISGGTLTKGIQGSKGCIADTDFGTDPEYIILQGGVNDADIIGGKDTDGNMPEAFGSYDLTDKNGEYDKTTFCGSLEALLFRLKSDYPNARIGYIISHKMGGNANGYYSYDAEHNLRRFYFETIIALCEKWEIDYIDLWQDCSLNPLDPAHNTGDDPYYYNGDYQHLTAKGYDLITPMIEEWMGKIEK